MTDIGELFDKAREGTLPKGFVQWGWANENGKTVAHEAAKRGRLPVGFGQWDLADNKGWTVAHVSRISRPILSLSTKDGMWEGAGLGTKAPPRSLVTLRLAKP
jgi:hypothetical protein